MADNPLQKLYEALETRDAERLAEINKLTKERDDLVEKLKQFELKSGGKDDQCQCTRSKDDSIMKMYEAQAIAIEKQIEVDKLKEEMNELKEKMDKLKMEKDAEVSKLAREKDDLMELLKRLGKDQEGKSGESGTKMEEMKKKNEELEERLKRLELNRVKEKIIGNPVSKQPQRNTILVLGDSGSNYTCLFLSADRTKWIEIDLTLPCGLPRAVVYLDDELYLIDIPTNGATTNTLYRLDRTLKWTRLVDMKKEHRYIRNSCLVENGYIWVFGGENREGSLASVERYDPKENKWTLMPDMKNARNSAAVTTWNNCIVISGGFEDFLKPTNTVECFNPENGSRTELPNMPKALHSHSLVSYKNKLILMGGFDGQSWLDSVWQLDPSETNPSWSPLPSMKYPSSQFAGIVFDEEIYAIVGKGEKHQLLDRVEIFDGKEWRDGPFLPYPMVNPSAMIIPQHFADLLCNL